MLTKYGNRWWKRVTLALALALGLAMVLHPVRAHADEPLGNALDWVPAEADVCVSSLRMGEQWQIVARSNAWKRFREIPVVAQYWRMAEDQLADPNGPLAAAVALMELPENQQLVGVLTDMHSHEVVFYAGDGFHKLIKALAELQGVGQWERILGNTAVLHEMPDEIEVNVEEEEEEVEDGQDDEVESDEDGNCDEDEDEDEEAEESDEADEDDEDDEDQGDDDEEGDDNDDEGEFNIEAGGGHAQHDGAGDEGDDEGEFNIELTDDDFGTDPFEVTSSPGSSHPLRTMLEMLGKDPSLLDVPDLVLAWRVEDMNAYTTQLKRLEVLAKLVLRSTPFGEDFTRQQLGEGEFLTLTLDGNKVDWNERQIPGLNEKDGEFDELRQQLAKKKVIVALGHWRNYAMLAVVASPERLERLGKVPALTSRKEFAPLVKHRPQRLVSVGYVSEALVAANAMTTEDLNGLVSLGKIVLQDAPLPGEMITRLHHDMEALATDLSKLITKPGAAMAYSFLNEHGYEGVSYDWNEYPALDATQTLPLAKHVGGNPLLAVVQRAKVDPAAYVAMTKWLGKGFSYFEDFAMDEMDETDREKAKAYLAELKPLAARADTITREQLLPALADGQLAVVVDAKITSKQWHPQIPASEVELPMLEIGLAIGVSNEALLTKAIDGYKQIADDLVEAVRKLDPAAIPAEYKIPLPEKTQIDGQTVLFYALPAAAQLDAQLAPSGGLADGVLVFSTSKAQVARMLKANEHSAWQGNSGTTPHAIAGSVHWAGMMEAVLPWVNYGVAHAPGPDSQIAQAMWPEVRQGLNLLKCLKHSEWTSTLEDGALVTHGATVVEDSQ